MDAYNNWERQKRALETEEKVRQKVAAIFPDIESSKVFVLFEDLGDLKHPRLVLDILRWVEIGEGLDAMKKLNQAIATAQQDPRDIWVIEYGRQFCASSAISAKEKLSLQAKDAQEHIDWLLK